MTSRTGRTSKPAAGFTLLEMLIVLVLIAVLAAIVAPSLGGFVAGRRVSDTAAQIVAMCHYAASQAAADGRAYRFNLDPKQHACWLTAEDSGFFKPLATSFGRRLVTDAEVGIAWQSPPEVVQRGYVQFQPSGSRDVASILVTGRRSRPIEIRCDSPSRPYHIVSENG